LGERQGGMYKSGTCDKNSDISETKQSRDKLTSTTECLYIETRVQPVDW